MTAAAATPVFAHLLRMTNHRGTFEHACLTEPRLEHGYCTDDMARVLVVTTRDPDPSGPVKGLAGKALQFLNDAQSYNGSCRNRMDHAGQLDRPAHHGRPLGPLHLGARHRRRPQRRQPGSPTGRDSVRARRQGQVALATGDGVRRRRCCRTAQLSSPVIPPPCDSSPTTPPLSRDRRPRRTGHGPNQGSLTRMRFCPRR